MCLFLILNISPVRTSNNDYRYEQFRNMSRPNVKFVYLVQTQIKCTEWVGWELVIPQSKNFNYWVVFKHLNQALRVILGKSWLQIIWETCVWCGHLSISSKFFYLTLRMKPNGRDKHLRILYINLDYLIIRLVCYPLRHKDISNLQPVFMLADV